MKQEQNRNRKDPEIFFVLSRVLRFIFKDLKDLIRRSCSPSFGVLEDLGMYVERDDEMKGSCNERTNSTIGRIHVCSACVTFMYALLVLLYLNQSRVSVYQNMN
jgi:hypothetical protein